MSLTSIFQWGFASMVLASTALAQILPVPQFVDHDRSVYSLSYVWLGRSSGYIDVRVSNTTGRPLTEQSYVWAFYDSSGTVVTFPLSDTFHEFPFADGAGTYMNASIPYGVEYTPKTSEVNCQYALEPGTYSVRVWVGPTSGMTFSVNAPPTGYTAVSNYQMTVRAPEIIVYVPSHNSLISNRDVTATLVQPVAQSYDRLVMLSGDGGLVPTVSMVTIPAGSHQVSFGVHVNYPAGRIRADAAGNDGSAPGGDGSQPAVETYWSALVIDHGITDSGSVKAFTAVTEVYPGPMRGDNQHPPADGDQGGNSHCMYAGGADPDPAGLPDFDICTGCPDDSPPGICKGVVPGTHVPLVTEGECASSTEIYGGMACFERTFPHQHCQVTTKQIQVKSYSLVGSESDECGFWGIGYGEIFIGWPMGSKTCCHFSLTNDNPTTLSVKTCTTITV